MSFFNRYLGAGISRNFSLEGRTDVELIEGPENVRQAIITIFNTEASDQQGFGGERIFNRKVGLNIRRFIFASDTPETIAEFKQELMRIQDFVPQIIIDRESLDIQSPVLENHKWLVIFPYTLVATGVRENLIVGILDKTGYARLLPNS